MEACGWTPAEKTLMGHVVWLRELLKLGLIRKARWCDTRHMSADGHTKGSIERHGLFDLMQGKAKFYIKLKTTYHIGETENSQRSE